MPHPAAVSNPFVVFNRACRPEQTCFLPPACRAVALGEACFETFRMDKHDVVNGFEQHLLRLQRGARMLGFDPGRHHSAFDFSPAEVATDILSLRDKWVGEIIKDSSDSMLSNQEFRIRIQIGRADSSGIYDNNPEHSAFFSLIRMFLAGPPSQHVRLWTSSRRRIPHQTLRRDVKWSFYLPNVQLIKEARQHNTDDALMLDGSGNISETATANVFLFINDELVTPPDSADALTGITQAGVIKAAETGGFALKRKAVTPAEARTAEAGFITNSMRGISPIAAIDDHALSVNHDGLRRVMQLFETHNQASARPLGTYQQ
jgi:branched-subunit amino acid aminotransferase/4-amino-4-deoxychorismate lyase